MSTFARTDTSLLSRWWWTIDRWTLAALISIALIGAVLILAASPPVAERIGLDPYYFARRQLTLLPIALALMLGTSLLSVRGVWRSAVACFIAAVALMVATLVAGEEIKGATRWLQIGGFSLQASEFVKPSLAVIAAGFFAGRHTEMGKPGFAIATGMLLVVAALLLLQPDVGMTLVVASVWGVQFFLAGLPLVLVGLVLVIILASGVGAYFIFPHVQVRIDRFLDPAGGDNYQVARGLEAFRNGGLFGRGVGEGRVKEVLPDAHADFIFAVAGEEFGLLVCLAVVLLFAFVVVRGLVRAFGEDNLFVMLTVSGLVVQFGLQAIINMASTLHLMPPKGMTLPFISYGGSSMLALAYGMGVMLALTRERPGKGVLA